MNRDVTSLEKVIFRSINDPLVVCPSPYQSTKKSFQLKGMLEMQKENPPLIQASALALLLAKLRNGTLTTGLHPVAACFHPLITRPLTTSFLGWEEEQGNVATGLSPKISQSPQGSSKPVPRSVGCLQTNLSGAQNSVSS